MRRAGLLAVLLVVLPPAGAASAAQPAGLEPGVHVDPGSPAAKEYALPLSQARKTGGGRLFGVGIRPPASARREEIARRAGRSGAEGGGHGTVGRRPAKAGVSTASDRTSTALAHPSPNATTSSGDSLLALLGGGVAILAVGALAGTILRRRPRAQDI